MSDIIIERPVAVCDQATITDGGDAPSSQGPDVKIYNNCVVATETENAVDVDLMVSREAVVSVGGVAIVAMATENHGDCNVVVAVETGNMVDVDLTVSEEMRARIGHDVEPSDSPDCDNSFIEVEEAAVKMGIAVSDQ